MALVLALQGGMAVGKTTAARWLAAHEPRVTVLLEDTAAPAAEVRRRGLDKRTFADYTEIQRIFIRHEIARWQAVQAQPCVVTDLGAEEIEFYTLHYPASIGQAWPVAQALAPELAALRRCRAARTLFLDASPAVLYARKQGDATRDRGFFAHSTAALLPAKRAWFAARPDVDFLPTDALTQEELCHAVHAWVRRCLAETTGKGASSPWNLSN